MAVGSRGVTPARRGARIRLRDAGEPASWQHFHIKRGRRRSA